MARKRGILTAVRSNQAFAELDLLLAEAIENTSHNLSIQRVVTAAHKFALTANDATYLETAREQQLPLATLDRRLAAAAGQAGVSLIS